MQLTSYHLRNGNFPPTAIALAAELGAELVNVARPTPPAVNWGYRSPGDGPVEGVLNSHAPVPDKLTAMDVMRDAGVQVPRTRLLCNGPGEQWIVRQFQHAQGRDILTADDVFLVEYIPKRREVRLDMYRHGDNYLAFRLHVKQPRDPREVVWNRANCEWHTYGRRDIRSQLRSDIPLNTAKFALQALGYDFGAVDLVQDGDNVWYVLEVNSAPRLGEVGVRQYARRIRRMLDAAD